VTPTNAAMRGRVCLITGGTSGIGAETARGLARLGATVAIVGRTADRAKTAVREIRQETGNENVDFLLADLSSQKDVRALASEFRGRYDRLDVLINNAGALFMNRINSVDGIEMTFALNHLSYFLLTNLLLGRLKASAPSRIVNVSSDAHSGATLDVANLQGSMGMFGMRAYGQSKLANLLFTYELARRLEGSGVTVNALHPGFVGSGFGKNNGRLARLGMSAVQRFAISPEKGAQTSIYLASSPEVAGVTGKYFVKMQPIPSSQASYDAALARRLWEISEEMTGLAPSPSGQPS
jgi:NAD(P)-dependent dehydrogenase (short-subunit alcohol dehydrogenase family)